MSSLTGVAVSSMLLLLLLAGSAVGYNDSESDSLMQWGSARATWFGQPNGAGPYDNGMHAYHRVLLFVFLKGTDVLNIAPAKLNRQIQVLLQIQGPD